MKKKVIFIVIILLIVGCVVGAILYFNNIKNNKKEAYEDSYNYPEKEIFTKNQEDVDAGIEALMNSDEYNILIEVDKIKSVGKLLDLYEENKVIKNLHYDDNGKMFTFQYSGGEIDGALGGVMLKEL